MKTTSRRVLSAALAINLLVPGLALAEDGPGGRDVPNNRVISSSPTRTPEAEPSESPHPEGMANTPRIGAGELCSKMSDLGGAVDSETTSRFNQLNNNFNQRGTNVAGQFDDATKKIESARATADAQRQQDFAKLEAKATTAQQKQAVATFEAAVLQAVKVRRAAIDAADATFRAGVLAAINQRQAQLTAAANAYKAAVLAAVTAAKASCAAGARPDVVRQNLQTALKAARTNLQTAQKNADKVHPNLDPLKAAHRAAIDKANADFRAAVSAAVAALKAILGSATPSPTVTPGA